MNDNKKLKELLLKNKNNYKKIIPDSDTCVDRSAKALDSGIKILIYSFDNCEFRKAIEFGHKIRQLCSIYEAVFIVKSRIDIAIILKADGILLTSNDININELNEFHTHNLLLGYQINDSEDLIYAIQNEVDYIIADNLINDTLKSNIVASNLKLISKI